MTGDPQPPVSAKEADARVAVDVKALQAAGRLDAARDRFAELVSRVSTPRTVPGVIALASGLLSVYSSTSGVVLPAILPAVPKLITQLGGGDPLAIASSVVIAGHVVDSSPLSTIGALCIASAPALENRQTLFNQMLAWGLAMAVVGAAICFLFFR